MVGWEPFRIGAGSLTPQLVRIKVVLLEPSSVLPLGAPARGYSERNGKNLQEDVRIFNIDSTILKAPFANMSCG